VRFKLRMGVVTAASCVVAAKCWLTECILRGSLEPIMRRLFSVRAGNALWQPSCQGNTCADLGDTGTIRRLISTTSARLYRDLRGMYQNSSKLNIVGLQPSCSLPKSMHPDVIRSPYCVQLFQSNSDPNSRSCCAVGISHSSGDFHSSPAISCYQHVAFDPRRINRLTTFF
jgi:hypothetical protein